MVLTESVDMEEGVGFKKMTRMIERWGKSEGETTDYVSTTVNDEEFSGNVDLENFMIFMMTWTKILQKILFLGEY